MYRYTLILGVFSALLLGACGGSQVARDENSQFFSIPVGSTFTLNRELTVDPDRTSVHLQNGRVSPVRGIDIYRPNCKFELFTISERARTVEPDTFVVTRIVDQLEDVSTQRPLYASLSVAEGGGGGNGGPLHQNYSTIMWLESNKQPDVFRLSCRRWDFINLGEYLSINEMRQALGDYFTLTLAPQS